MGVHQDAEAVVAEAGPSGVRADVLGGGAAGGDGFAVGEERGPRVRTGPSGWPSGRGSRRDRSRTFSETAVVVITAKSAGREVFGLATAGVRLA